MIRKPISSILTAAAILALSSCAKNDGFTIHGTLTGDAEGARVLLFNPDIYPQVNIDTNDSTDTQPDLRNKMCRINLYLENSDITIEGDINTLPSYFYNPERKGKAIIHGSATQELAENFRESTKYISARLAQLDKEYLNDYALPELDGKDAGERGIEIVKEENILRKQLDEATAQFIRDNASSAVAFDEASYIINRYRRTPSVAEIDSLMALLAPTWEGTERYETLKKSAEASRRLAVGEPYIDLKLLNAQGDTVKLSSLVPEGKYVMLEFWASWCGSCRAEIPHLAKVHKKYPDFEIISISVDSDDKDWQKAMKEEGMVWTQLRNPNGMEGDVQEKYNIFGVPTCLLLDCDGRFLKSNMRGAYLDEFLSDTYPAADKN